MSRHLFQSIPQLPGVDNWKQLPIRENREQLVPLGMFSEYTSIATDSIYAGERRSSPYGYGNIEGALLTVFVREGVAKRLVRASKKLPPRHMLLVWDGYRPLSVQQALFDYYLQVLVNRGTPYQQAVEDAQTYVSIPCTDPTKPPPHFTGGSVDLTIIQFAPSDWKRMETLNRIVSMPRSGTNWGKIYTAEMERQQLIREASVPLNMGTVFDGVQPETTTRFYEELLTLSSEDQECLHNRRLLYHVMNSAGFSNYHNEWWHYDFGNQFHTARTKKRAIYGAIHLSEDNLAWEQMRIGHYQGHVALRKRAYAKVSAHTLLPFVSKVTEQSGDLGYTIHPRAATI